MLRGVVGVPQLGGDEELGPGADPRLKSSPDAFTHLECVSLGSGGGVSSLAVQGEVSSLAVQGQVSGPAVRC